MNKKFIAAGLVGFATLSIAYAQEDKPRRSSTGQVQSDQHASHQNQKADVSIEEALLKKLMKGNEGEIELAKLAQQHSTNQEVKNLAQHLITDHQSMNQNLEKVHKSVIHNDSSAGATDSNARNDTSSTGRNQTAGHMMAMVPHEFCQIGEKACENNLKMTKEMLSQYKGQNFDMAYLGQQCVAHTMTLAELRAIESDGPQELKKTAMEASAKVQEHLDMIKELSKKLEDDRKAPNS